MMQIFNHIMRRAALCLLLAFCCSAALQAKTYIVAVGLNKYKNSENNLPCSAADVQDLTKFYRKRKDCTAFVLLDANATREHILRVLKTIFAKSTYKDEIIFAYSGHGYDGGITSYDIDELVTCAEIQDIMHRTKARRKIMYVNSCHSGTFKKRHSRNATPSLNENTSVMLFLSSREEEDSWEAYEMRRSFFYDYLIKGLAGNADKNSDKKVTARELFNYVAKNVTTCTRGMQHPVMYGKFPDDMILIDNY